MSAHLPDESLPAFLFFALRARLIGAPCPGCGGICGPDSGLGLLIVDGRRFAHLICGACSEASATSEAAHARIAQAIELCMLPTKGEA